MKPFSDNHYRYTLPSVRVENHAEEWSGYYRLGEPHTLILVGIFMGDPPGVLTIPIRSYEDLEKYLG